MRPSPQNILSGVLALAAGLLVTGCFVSEQPMAPPTHQGDGEFSLSMRVGVGSVGALGKSATITLSKLIIVLSSNVNDTIRDTITSSTTPVLNTVSTTDQTVSKNYNLKALRVWKIVATTKDLGGNVIHSDSTTMPALQAGDVAAVNLSLAARYGMYTANFTSLPDSVESATPSQPKQKLNINRLQLLVDGVSVKDSTVSPGPYYPSGTPISLSYDYVLTGKKSTVSSGTSQDLYAVQFPTVDTGYIVGENVTLRSINGGASWSTLTTGGTSKSLRGLSFLTGSKGVIAGGSDSVVIRRTTNGGSSWTRVLGTNSANIVRAIHLVNDTGWMVRSHVSSLTGSYQYYVTYDAGATWTPTLSQDQIYSVRGVNGTTAWAVGPAGKIRKNTAADGFFSTVQASGTSRTLRSVFPVNASLVIVVGDSGTILRTVDGGSNWTSKTSGTLQNLNSVWFLDAATGFAVGDSGKVLSTSDSGNTWSSETSPTTANLNSVNFFGGNGYVVGAGGTLFTISGSHLVEMRAYGPLGTWNVANPLYSGSKYINTVSGTSTTTVSLTLQWVGPSSGTGSITATLGKVGKITVNGVLPGTNLP